MHTARRATITETVYKLMDERLDGSIITLAGLLNLAAKLDEERTDWSPAFILTGTDIELLALLCNIFHVAKSS